MPSWRGAGRGHRSHRPGPFDQPAVSFQLVITHPDRPATVQPAPDRSAALSTARQLSARGARVEVQRRRGWEPFRTTRTLEPAPEAAS